MLQDEATSTPSPVPELMHQLHKMRRERDCMRSSNSALQEEVQRYRSHVGTLQSHGDTLSSLHSVAETTKAVTNKVIAY